MKNITAVLFALALVSCSGDEKGVITASGVIEGTNVQVGTEVAGRVLEVRVQEGARVARGDTLLVIDDTEYRLQMQQSAANLASFESAYRLAAEGSRKEDIVQARAAYTSAEADYQRMKNLLASHAVTQKQFDDAEAKYIAAQQTYEKLQRGLRPEEVANARQKRDAAAAQVELLKKRIRDCRLTSPSVGTVTLRAVQPGELVSMGMNLLRITNLDRVKLTIYLPEQQIGSIRIGQSANVSIDNDQHTSYPGTITYISPTAEFTPKNVQTKEERTKLVFAVRIEVENPTGALKPGLPADARIETGTQQK